MSFSFNKKNTIDLEIDVQKNYEKIGEEFCKHYYSIYDNNFFDLAKLYSNNPCITFMDNKFGNCNALLNSFISRGFYSFTHYKIVGNCQPIGKNALLITVVGKLSINNKHKKNKFCETFAIKRDNMNNFFIFNNIFKIID